MAKYLIPFFLSMVPLLELRGGVPVGVTMGLSQIEAIILCAIGNMIPVPIIYFFARKFLIWGADKKYIGKICTFFLVKGEHGGQKLTKATGRGGLFVALLLFVGIPLPGTGAWTGTLAASFLNMGFKSAVLAVVLGVLLAGIIMATASTAVLGLFGL